MQDLWDATQSYTRVILRGVQTQAHVGLHPWERHPEHPTRLIVDVEMFAHGGADTRDTIMDYDPVRAELRGWPTRPHTDLLETLVERLVAVCFTNPRVEACRVCVMKPDIFGEADGAGVQVYRIRTP